MMASLVVVVVALPPDREFQREIFLGERERERLRSPPPRKRDGQPEVLSDERKFLCVVDITVRPVRYFV